jgi:pimeloyl-ACP methyl ester carboxylesterase
MTTRKINTPNGAVSARESTGKGPAIVLLHGNSASSRAFSKQLDGPLGARFHLVALDLPGHGESEDAKDPALYEI